MKKISFILLLFGILVLSGCSKQKVEEEQLVQKNNTQTNEEILNKQAVNDNVISKDTKNENDDGFLKKITHPKHNFSVSFPENQIKNYYDEKSGWFMFCQNSAPDKLEDFIPDRDYKMIKHGCLDSMVFTNQTRSFEDFLDRIHNKNMEYDCHLDGPKQKLNSKDKITLGENIFYKINYRDSKKGGSYYYVTKTKEEKLMQFYFCYDDYSLKNDYLISIYEKMLTSLDFEGE
jgi:hypothetical protein